MRVTGETDRMDVTLDTDEEVIWITQKWKCNFLAWEKGIGKWTRTEQSYYKRELISVIQTLWSDRAYAIVNTKSGTSFNQEYGKINFRIKVKIEYAEVGYHWEINICKLKSFEQTHDFISWDTRQMYINNFSTKKTQYLSINDSTHPGSFFWPAAHEFGHMIGNTRQCYGGGTGDEYPTLHYLQKDAHSIMNMGNEIRHRHFTYIRHLLQEMIPGSHFSIHL